MERALWEKPVDGGAISNRGKLEAAKAQVVVLLTTMKARGCKEEFEPNPTLLQNGQVSPMEHRRNPQSKSEYYLIGRGWKSDVC